LLKFIQAYSNNLLKIFKQANMRPLYITRLTILIALLLGWNLNAKAQCNCAWLYKVPVTVNNLGSTALTNYQVSVTLNTAALVSAGKMQASGNDIRFADASCTNISYWIEPATMNTAATKIWIKVPSLPSSGSTSFTMYYGNPAAPAGSNGTNTFVIFDDFLGSTLDNTKWTQYVGSGTTTVSGGNITLTASGSYNLVESISSFPNPYLLEVNVVNATGTFPILSQGDNGNYSSSSAVSMFYWQSTPAIYTGTNQGSTPIFAWSGGSGFIWTFTPGLWTMLRTSSSTILTYPGGTLPNGAGSSQPQSVAFGLPNNGSSGSIVVDWVRGRQYYASGASVSLGAEVTHGAAAITGSTSICLGSTSVLADATSGGTWSSSATSVAPVSSAGAVNGLSLGTATISYSVPSGCVATAAVSVNLGPAITGTPVVCEGLTTTLTGTPSGGTWSSSNTALATAAPGGVITGVSAGNPTITYIAGSGCTSIAPITVNPAPAAILGTASACVGASTLLTNSVSGGTWSSNASSVASISGSGLVTGNSVGNATITYTLPSGCYSTRAVTVNPQPAVVTGASAVCVGSSTSMGDVTPGGAWTTGSTTIATVGPTGLVTGVTAGTTTVVYTLPTGCSSSASIVVNPLPAAITGTTNACVGSSSTLSDATSGGLWSSSNPGFATVLPASGVVTAVSAGTTNITYTLGTGCYTSVPFAANVLPTAYNVTGGGGYCVGASGVHVGLNFSDLGVNYRLYNGSTLVSTLGGLGSGLDFGLQTTTGTYTAVGINATSGCINNMAGSTTVSISPLPNIYTVSGGGSVCAGAAGPHVMISGSDASVNYQLYINGASAGSPLPGTGSAIDFGAQTVAGTYTVVATNPATGCVSNMTGSAAVTVNPLPNIYTLGASGAYCAGGTGVDVVLGGSDAGVNYQLYYGGIASGSPLPGSGAPLHFGLHTGVGVYTVGAVNTVTGCSSNMAGSTTISVNPLPIVYPVNGGGSFCVGGSGVHVGLNFSDVGINYQLYRGGTPVGGLVGGSNAALDFGLQTVAGTYTVIGFDAITGCQKNMSGSASVSTTALPNVYNVIGGGSYCAGGTGVHVGLSGSSTGVLYQLYYAGSPDSAAVSGTGGALDFGIRTLAGSYTVTATNIVTSCTSMMSGSAVITINSIPTAYTVTGLGTSYCAGGPGVDIMLMGSDGTVSYRLYNGSTAIGLPVTGTGSSLDLGFQAAAGTYTVVGTDLVTGCIGVMSGSAPIAVNPIPVRFTTTGGGSYCAGGLGAHVGLSGSNVGINYQLNNSGGPTGLPMAGSGTAIDFGYQTTGDNYFIVATNTITGCNDTMTGVVPVVVNPIPNVYSVMGGGNYCAGTGGVDITLGGSDIGLMYQLYMGSTPSGAAMTGTGGSIDFGNRTTAGTYTVIATDPLTTCSGPMGAMATVGINALPLMHSVTGGGAYCAPGGSGVNVNLDASETGINYQLLYLGSPAGSAVAGTGGSISFGLQTGVGAYTVLATDTTTGCTSTTTSSAVVSTNPAPAVDSVIGGGNYCAGGTGRHIGIDGTTFGIQYQLYRGTTPVGSLISGTGGPVDFGAQTVAGTYTIVASPGGVCETNMDGSAMINITPLPNAHSLTGGGNYCNGTTGVNVGTDGSDAGVKYQLYVDGVLHGAAMNGTGSALDFGPQTTGGTYTLVATDTTSGCSANTSTSGMVTVNLLPLPASFNVTGGGAYCAGGTGVHVTLAGSATNVNYQLSRNGVSLGSAYMRPGTGTLLDFGPHTTAGNYTIIGTDAASNCVKNMSDTAVVSINPILTPSVTIAAHPGFSIVKGQRDTLVANVTTAGTAPEYQWMLNGFPIPGATNSTFISNKFSDLDTVTCVVTSSGDCGGITRNAKVAIHVGSGVGVAQVTASDMIVSVVPNPNKGTFSIIGSLGTAADEEMTLEMTDLLGHVVYSGKTMSKNGAINERVQLDNVANGMYILSIRAASENKVFHVVVEQ